MAKLCKDHIIDRDDKQLDLSLWLEDIFTKHKLYKYAPRIIMGERTFDIFMTIIEGIEQIHFGYSAYRFKAHTIPKSWITIDPTINPYYIRIMWEESENDGFRINKIFTDDVLAYSSIFFNDPRKVPEIKKVIYNDPATIILWSDHTKTVVQCQKDDKYDPEKGLAMAIAKKALGNTSRKLNDVLHKWEKKEEPPVCHSCATCKYGDRKLSKEPCKSCDSSFWSNWEADK